MGAYGLDGDLVEPLHEQFAVFCVYDGLHRGAEHLYSVFLQDAALVELHAAVERGLAAEGEQDALRALLLYHPCHEIRGDGEEIDPVRNPLGGLHRGDVGIHQDGLYPVFAQGLERLRAAVVEFSGLSDLECAGTQEYDFLYGFVEHGLES